MLLSKSAHKKGLSTLTNTDQENYVTRSTIYVEGFMLFHEKVNDFCVVPLYYKYSLEHSINAARRIILVRQLFWEGGGGGGPAQFNNTQIP